MSGLGGGVEEPDALASYNRGAKDWKRKKSGGKAVIAGLDVLSLEMPVRHFGDVKKQLETGVWSSELKR